MSDLTESAIPDEDLMARMAAGDRCAFEILIQRHETSVFNLIHRFIDDAGRAEDLAQELFVRVWQAAPKYKPTAKFTTWMYRIAANLCLNELKSPWRRKLVSFHWLRGDDRADDGDGSGDPRDERPSPEDLLLALEQSRRLSNALQCLPEKQRLALLLKVHEGLPYQEIAQVLGCSVSAVESLLVRAKRNLQEKMKPGRK